MYRIIVDAHDEEEPRGVMDFYEGENGWRVFHELCRIGADASEQITAVEYWRIDEENNRSYSLACCMF